MFFGASPLPQPSSPKPAWEEALANIRQALKQECQEQSALYLLESKKLYLSLLEAYEIQGRLRRQGQTPEAADLLQQELRNQLLGFALMQCLPDQEVRDCAQQAQRGERQGPSRAELLVQELEKRLQHDSQTEQQVSRWLLLQPLFRLSNQQPQLFLELAQNLGAVARKVPELLRSTNEAILRQGQISPPLR